MSRSSPPSERESDSWSTIDSFPASRRRNRSPRSRLSTPSAGRTLLATWCFRPGSCVKGEKMSREDNLGVNDPSLNVASPGARPTEESLTPEETYPSVGLAYELAVQSYDW